MKSRDKIMLNLAAAVACLLTLMTVSATRAEPDYFVWSVAHERMLARWRWAEPRCGWTVGGYTCATRAMRGARAYGQPGAGRRKGATNQDQ